MRLGRWRRRRRRVRRRIRLRRTPGFGDFGRTLRVDDHCSNLRRHSHVSRDPRPKCERIRTFMNSGRRFASETTLPNPKEEVHGS
jgi:hypothetical protein